MNARFADLTLTEAAQRLRRYRPLAVTVVLTLGTLRALPEHGAPVEASLQPTAPATAIAPAAQEPAPDPMPDSPPASDVASSVALPRLSPRAAAPPASAPVTTTTAATATPPAAAPPSTAQPESAVPTVLHTGWATRAAGTPAGTIGVPDDSLPVGNRVGQTDKASFLRLSGEWQSITVGVVPDGSAGVGEPSVQACSITTAAWEPFAGSSFDEAPEWDPDGCAAGVPGATGDEWTFELGGIDHRFGVALVPGPDAPVEFQIAFRSPA